MAIKNKIVDQNKLFRPDKTDTIDDFFSYTQPLGSISRAIANNLYGINCLNNGNIVPSNKDDYGLTFFTRPQLNLRNQNLSSVNKLDSFLTNNPSSIHRYIRMMLDPRLAYSMDLRCPFLDNRMAFIPILTNNLKSMSGWPDPYLPTYSTPEGLRREQWTIGDGVIDIYNAFSIDCNFRNTQDEPIILMFKLWTHYIALVFEGMIAPYTDMLIENEIDYNTRIYRLILDPSRRFVKKIGMVGAALPVVNPQGKFFDYQENETYNMQNKTINIRFECNGAQYDDSIIAKEFNMVGEIFNPELRALGKKQPNNLEKVPIGLYSMFNHRLYPRINLDTLELEWYVDKNTATYKRMLNYLN